MSSSDTSSIAATMLPSGRRAPRPPKAAAELVEHARAARWKTLVQWGEDSAGAPFLSVQLGTAEPFHHYTLTWHSRGHLTPVDPAEELTRDVSTARLRLFSMLLTTGGTGGRSVDVASLKSIRHTITEHPA